MTMNSSLSNESSGRSLASMGRFSLFALCLAASPVDAQLPAEEQLPDRIEPPVEAQRPEYHLYVRPLAGVGWTYGVGDSRNGLGLHAGGRILFSTPLSHKIGAKLGVEATYLELDVRDETTISERYVLVGIVLEMTLFQNLLMTTGTVGYIGLGDTEGNPFGIVTDVGWEPAWDSRVVPYVTLRSEFLFGENVYSVLSLSVGSTIGVI